MATFSVSTRDAKLIIKIVVRAASILNLESHGSSRLDLAMDLTACHANGCSLDLARLLSADRFNLSHDLLGIIRHLNRKTGKVEEFCPRYAA